MAGVEIAAWSVVFPGPGDSHGFARFGDAVGSADDVDGAGYDEQDGDEETADSASMPALAQVDMGRVSVGLKAVALVNAR